MFENFIDKHDNQSSLIGQPLYI